MYQQLSSFVRCMLQLVVAVAAGAAGSYLKAVPFLPQWQLLLCLYT
jgi:hypothetical protein